MTPAPTTPDFVVCVETGPYRASLELWKIHQVMVDPEAERHGQLRVQDESGEDYLYPARCFRPIELSPDLEARFSSTPATGS